MAKQILAIGDTGSQLVSKFNNNFDDSYNDISAIKALNYLLSDTCSGDAETDNTTAFGTLLTTIGANYATIKVPNGRFIIGTCTIPANVELVFENGGRIIWKSGSTVVIKGHINAGHKWIFENESEVVENLPTIGIHNQTWVSPIWFGGKSDGNNDNATTNYNAFRSAWNAVDRLSQTADGCSICFPSGTYIMNGFTAGSDGFGDAAKYADIIGEGKTKTTIMLASGQNKALFKLSVNYDFNIRNIGFNGNASANAEMTEELLSVNYYRIYFENVFITNVTSNGLYVKTGQSNAWSFHNLTITHCGGTGLVLEDALCFSLSGMIDIENCGGAIDVKQTGSTWNDSRYNMRGIINASIYMESCTTGIRLYGVSGIYIKALMYARDTVNLVELIYDTTDDRNMPCYNNVIDISQSKDDKLRGYQFVTITDKCFGNDIITNGGIIVTDSDGRNKVTPRSNKGSCQKEISNDFSGINYFTDTHPYNCNGGKSEQVANVTNSPLPDLYAYIAGVSSINALSIPDDAAIRHDVTLVAGTYYLHCLIKGNPGNWCYLMAEQITGDDYYYYDFSRKAWSLFTDVLNIRHWEFELNGEVQYFSIPITVSEAIAGDIHFKLYSKVGTFEVYYWNLSNNANQGMVHVASSAVIGYNYEPSFIASGSLPAATEVKIGTRNFCTDLGMEVISDGTNWKKPDGTNLT